MIFPANHGTHMNLPLSCHCIIAELKALLQYITGAPTVQGNSIIVSFDAMKSSAMTASITANTCGREVQLSIHIKDEQQFFQELTTVFGEHDFTTP